MSPSLPLSLWRPTSAKSKRTGSKYIFSKRFLALSRVGGSPGRNFRKISIKAFSLILGLSENWLYPPESSAFSVSFASVFLKKDISAASVASKTSMVLTPNSRNPSRISLSISVFGSASISPVLVSTIGLAIIRPSISSLVETVSVLAKSFRISSSVSQPIARSRIVTNIFLRLSKRT